MARFRKVDPRIWNDAKFSALTGEAQLLFFYLLTCPQMTHIGAIPMREEAVAAELHLDTKRYAIRYEELYREGMVKYDSRGLFWVRNFLKYNAPDNPKVVLSWRDSLDLLPECPLLAEVIGVCRKHCESRGPGYVEAFEKGIGNGSACGMPYGMAYQEQEQEQEQKQKVCIRTAPPETPKTERPKTAKGSRRTAASIQKPDDVSDQVWTEWLALRKAKRAQVTPFILDRIRKQAERVPAKYGFTFEDALLMMIDAQWTGFEAEWVVNRLSRTGGRATAAPQGFTRELSAEERARNPGFGITQEDIDEALTPLTPEEIAALSPHQDDVPPFDEALTLH